MHFMGWNTCVGSPKLLWRMSNYHRAAKLSKSSYMELCAGALVPADSNNH